MENINYPNNEGLFSAIIAEEVCKVLNRKSKGFAFNYSIEKKYIHIYFTHKYSHKRKIGFIHKDTMDFFVSRNANDYQANIMDYRVVFKGISNSDDDISKVVKYLIKNKIAPYVLACI